MTTVESPSGARQDRNESDVLDVLVIGGGFSGLYQLDRLRDLGFDVKVWDAAGDFGGIWWWNCYPGARTDTVGHIYQFAHKDLWREFDFRERYPDFEGVRDYFAYIDGKLDLRRDVEFSTVASRAVWHEDRREWTVYAADGKRRRARTVLVATGFGAKPLYPDIPGMDTFAGECHHTARWPQEGLDMTGRRVVVIGTGASGVQVVQEAARDAAAVTVFQRTPNLALPMRQRILDHADNDDVRTGLPERFETRYRAFAGFDFDFMPQEAAKADPEELRATYERFWADGGFPLWLGMYYDLLVDETANRTFYDFWREKVRARVHDPATAELLAPTEPPHPFGVKRPALEQNYFDVFNQDNVALIDQNDEPVLEIIPAGVLTRNGLIECDVIALATGFDSNRGGILAIDIEGVGGQRIQDKWAGRVDTVMGLATAGFPNLLFLYGPQSPSGFCNGPTSAEYQGDIVVEFLEHVRATGATRFEATGAAEQAWSAHVDGLFEGSLFTKARSWYWGANVPGKPAQMLNYSGGLVSYFGKWDEVRAGGYREFDLG